MDDTYNLKIQLTGFIKGLSGLMNILDFLDIYEKLDEGKVTLIKNMAK